MAELNTTGYALLGLLNQHPWSAYELTRFMRVSYLRAIWPRAESRLYEGPKKLIALGFATASKERQGQRSRTVYTITDSGREALAAWLSVETRDVVFEHEALLQLGNCDVGELRDVEVILDRLRESTGADLEEMAVALEVLGDPAAERLSSDKRFVLNTLVNTFIFEVLLARRRWLACAEQLTADWGDLEPSEDKLAAVHAHYRELARRLQDEDSK
ncbi:MAG: PadR family transcriptional regulator [Halioglobus sp.]|nr:PadR family transcriptional regulator [Halioglobus sp.]